MGYAPVQLVKPQRTQGWKPRLLVEMGQKVQTSSFEISKS